MNCYVYVVQCSSDSLYTGITSNIRKRIEQHNGMRIGGAFHTRMHRPVFLQHIEKYPTRKDARKREKEIQSWGHDEKTELIRITTKGDILSSI
ncbi:GIY-YIG nuclease family protein [Candidatus Pacebacteria bacterium]|nr:GIY-YIG nuclease family protein [Candidatus Paceibacterota bacterium]